MSVIAISLAAIAAAVQPQANGPISAQPNSQSLLEDVIAHPPANMHVEMEVYTLPPRRTDKALEEQPGHRHPGHMYVYVLEGQVRSKLDDAPAANFAQGTAWLEQPGQLHRILNLSHERPARLLVVAVEPADSAAKE